MTWVVRRGSEMVDGLIEINCFDLESVDWVRLIALSVETWVLQGLLIRIGVWLKLDVLRWVKSAVCNCWIFPVVWDGAEVKWWIWMLPVFPVWLIIDWCGCWCCGCWDWLAFCCWVWCLFKNNAKFALADERRPLFARLSGSEKQ